MTRVRWWVTVILAGASVSCPGDDPAPAASCWCVPPVQSIRIVPSSFEVQPGSTFELRAQLFAADGTEIPEFFSYAPHWTITSGANVNVVRREGHTVTLDVPSSIAVSQFDVTAEAGSSTKVVSSPSTGRVLKTTPIHDHIIADPRSNGMPLSVALAADAAALTWNVTPVAFSGLANLGDLQTSGGVMVFSSDHAMAFALVSWTTASNAVHYQPGTFLGATVQEDPKPVLTKNVTIWIDPAAGADQWPATTAEAIMRVHLADANRTFLRNRIGVQFNLKEVFNITDGTPENHCGTWATTVLGEPFGGGTTTSFDPTSNTNEITVFVMDMGIGTGFACHETGDLTPGYRIFVNGALTLPNVLGHELGHTLLKTAVADHTDAAPMGSSNLMVQGDDDNGAPRRTRLSLGQACEMNRSAVVSVMRTATVPPLLVPTACPPVTKDVP